MGTRPEPWEVYSNVLAMVSNVELYGVRGRGLLRRYLLHLFLFWGIFLVAFLSYQI